jgi:hypothetical protein
MAALVGELVENMEAHPPPQHTMGAHLMNCTNPKTGEKRAELAGGGERVESCGGEGQIGRGRSWGGGERGKWG